MSDSNKIQYYKQFTEDFLKENNLMESPKKNMHCIDPAHEDVHPSAHFYEDKNIVKCFGCGKTFDIYDALGFQYGLKSFKDQLAKAEELYGPVPDSYDATPQTSISIDKQLQPVDSDYVTVDQTVFFEDCNRTLNKINDEGMLYLKSRGISLDTANQFKLGHYWSDQYPPNRLVIPTSKYTYNTRSIDAGSNIKYCRLASMPVVLFNKEALNQKRYPVFIVEGELDAISIEQLGFKAVALGSASNIGLISTREDLDKLEYPMIIALDHDETGSKRSNDLRDKLDKKSIQYVVSDSLYGNFKDANECLVNEPDEFKKRLESAVMLSLQMKSAVSEKKAEELEWYKSQSVKSHKDAYIQDRMLQLEPISTGYSKLDEVLNGGLQPGRVYTIGAISSLGKTTFFNQMAESISSDGTSVLYYTLEMSESELNSKGVSRNTFKVCMANPGILSTSDAKTSNEVDKFWRNRSDFSENDKKIIKYATDDYFENGAHLYIHDDVSSLSDIRKGVVTHIRVTEELPIVFVDYLQIMPPNEKGLTDKANMDGIILGLKDMARKYNIPIVVISSFNRQNYGQQANMTAFKESGSIEYSSDVVIALEFSAINDNEGNYNEVDERAKDIRNVDVVILKNRNGKSGARIHYAFYTRYSFFYEK